MISSDVIRGYSDILILFLLVGRDSYGYEISKDIRELTGEKYIMKETTLYSAFTRLEKSGYIASYYKEGPQRKRRTYFHITDEGRRHYAEKCAEWRLVKEVVNQFIIEGE